MIASLHIKTTLRNGLTYLGESYFTPPFKLADVREDKKAPTLQLMLMSSSPGILDGDEYDVKIDLAEGCSLRLSTQSYQRLFTMKGSAKQNMEVSMAKNSSFCYLPHPTVPHEGSDFKFRSKIYLSGGCSLIWGEILTCGRKQNGEVFRFSRYHALTEIYLNGKLVVKENLMIHPSQIDMNTIGQLEGYTHQASLIYLSEDADIKALRQDITGMLAVQPQITYGITETPVNGLLIRILGHKGEQLYNCLNKIAEMIAITKSIKPAYA